MSSHPSVVNREYTLINRGGLGTHPSFLQRLPIDGNLPLREMTLAYIDAATQECKPIDDPALWNADLATTRTDLKASFAGVVMNNASTNHDPVCGLRYDAHANVESSSQTAWDVDVVPGTVYKIGDFLGPVQDGAANALRNVQMEVVPVAEAIAQVVAGPEQYTNTDTKVRVVFVPTRYNPDAALV